MQRTDDLAQVSIKCTCSIPEGEGQICDALLVQPCDLVALLVLISVDIKI